MSAILGFKSRNKDNCLEFIPTRNKKISWSVKENIVILEIERKGFFDKIAQKFFKRPKKSYIRLDELSSFVWLNIDGKRNINDIAMLVREKFKEKAEPLYNRLITFFKILYDNKFIL